MPNVVLYISKLLTICICFIAVECYNRGANKWIGLPCLNHEKGHLAGATLNGKIFAIGGGDGSQSFSEVEMFDPAAGKWIYNLSMQQPVWFYFYSLITLV